jgi:hypothetical protein
MALINTADKIYLGSTLASRVYAGATQVWPTASGAFLPTSLAGLRVWLDASQLPQVEAFIYAWPNIAPGGDPSPTFVNGGAYMSLTAVPNRPIVLFERTGGRLRATTSVMQDYTITYICRCYSIGRVFAGRYPEGSNFIIGHHASQGMDIMYTGTAFIGTPTPLTSAWRMYTGDGSSDGSYRLFVNGPMTGSAATGNAGLNGYWNLSGYSATGDEETATFDIVELLIYNRRLTDTERGQVHTYMTEKWAI